MSLHLVTGHSGKAHITAADQGALNACMFGTKDYVLNSGNNFAASVITNNQVRIADGELMMQGRHVRLAKDTYEELVIENGTQGMNRNDLIVVRYTKNIDSGIEGATFAVIKGTETTGTAVDPEYTTGDILSGDALHEMPLYRIPLTGLNVGTPVLLFKTVQESGDALENLGGISKTLLWENKAPNSEFPAQPIPLDLSEYNFVEIMSDLNGYRVFIMSKHLVGGLSVITSGNEAIGATNINYLRRIECTTSGITFNDAYFNNTLKNNYLIPHRIYGIKGVQ